MTTRRPVAPGLVARVGRRRKEGIENFRNREVPKRLTSHADTMLLLHQCVIYTHFVRIPDGKMGLPGLWREKKMYNVSKPYLM